MGCCYSRKDDSSKKQNDSQQNQPSTQLTDQQQQSKQIKRILLVGKAGVGKTKLFNQIKGPREKYQNQKFSEVVLQGQDYVAVDTPAFEMENTIDEREKTIKQFQDYFSSQKDSISTLGIVVNFERTDLMKRKVSDVYKYLHKFKEMIVLIVVGWELNDNPDVNEIYLQRSFQLFSDNIIFISKNSTNVVEEIKKIVKPKPQQPIDLNNTIFEYFDSNTLDMAEFFGNIVKKSQQNKDKIV